jgi:DNA-binding IclR family transcriptional regulator
MMPLNRKENAMQLSESPELVALAASTAARYFLQQMVRSGQVERRGDGKYICDPLSV